LGTDSAEGGHFVGLADQGVFPKLDRVSPRLERGCATEDTAPCRQARRRTLFALEQATGVCKVAGPAAVRAGVVVPRVPVAETTRDCALSLFVTDWPLTKKESVPSEDCALPERDPVLAEVSTLAYVGPGHQLEEVVCL
jgi:hypothetical protein